MTTSADRLISRGLAWHVEGDRLSAALADATEEEVRLRSLFAMSRYHSPWLDWRAALSGADQYERPRLLEECFNWTMRTYAERSGDFVRRVAVHLSAGHDAARAVELALDEVAATQLHRRWRLLALRLYSPEQVQPFLAPFMHPSVAPAAQRLLSLTRWVNHHVTWVSDEEKWHSPDFWQTPETTLLTGSGDCEDQALVLWSAAPLLGLPRGRLVIGTLDGGGHAWVEFPEFFVPLIADSTSGSVLASHQALSYCPDICIEPSDRRLAS
jgi:transglutaminase-like putative cysteine protease